MARGDVDAYLREGKRRQARWVVVGWIASTVAVAIGVIIVYFVACNGVPADDERVMETLRTSGLRDAILGGADLAACADNESSRHFAATSALGQRVEGTVCSGPTGLGKGCTIRVGR